MSQRPEPIRVQGMGRPKVIPAADPTYDICATTGKRRYATKQAARKALHEAEQFARTRDVPCRSYQCGDCHGWHLTSHRFRPRLKF